MDIQSFFISLLNVVCEMAPYLLLGFFIAGVLHVFVPLRKCLALRKPRPVLLPTPSPSKALPQKRPYVLPLKVSAIRLRDGAARAVKFA
jgi:hypothetical protein